VARALAADPDQRFETAAELRERLRWPPPVRTRTP
jgi:hypothetical protein